MFLHSFLMLSWEALSCGHLCLDFSCHQNLESLEFMGVHIQNCKQMKYVLIINMINANKTTYKQEYFIYGAEKYCPLIFFAFLLTAFCFLFPLLYIYLKNGNSVLFCYFHLKVVVNFIFSFTTYLHLFGHAWLCSLNDWINQEGLSLAVTWCPSVFVSAHHGPSAAIS